MVMLSRCWMNCLGSSSSNSGSKIQKKMWREKILAHAHLKLNKYEILIKIRLKIQDFSLSDLLIKSNRTAFTDSYRRGTNFWDTLCSFIINTTTSTFTKVKIETLETADLSNVVTTLKVGIVMLLAWSSVRQIEKVRPPAVSCLFGHPPRTEKKMVLYI